MTQALSVSAARLWRDYPRETLGFGVLGFAGVLALAGAAYSTPNLSGIERVTAPAEAAAPPAPPPLLVRELPVQQAISVNEAIPLLSGPNPPARPFAFTGNAAARAQALECLASAIYYEAGNESADGQRAVAQVVLNRVRHAAFPSTVCGVVYQGSTRPTGCQFTFTCDGSLARRPGSERWTRATQIAAAALSGAVYAPVGYATHYHANYVVPYWASSLAKNAIVGAHIFYRWAGGWGRPVAFDKRYAGYEPSSHALRSAALAAEAAQPALPPAVAEAVEQIPGAELKKAEQGRVAVQFKMAARKAVEEAPRKAYVEKFEASENLRWNLGAGATSNEAPLGKQASATPQAGGSGAGAPKR